MAEYISKEALLAAYDAAHVGEPGRARKLIAEATAADVAPVRHGRWNSVEDIPRFVYACSECGFRVGYGMMLHCNYCPNCGADMKDGE